MATLCLSNGVPMITAGDERGPHPGRQQQRLLPGQRDLLGRLAPRRRLARRLRDHQDRAAAAPRAPGAAPAALVRGPADDPRRAQGPGLAAPLRSRDDRRRLARPDAARRSGCSSPALRCAPPARAASSRSTRRSCSGSTPAARPARRAARERLGADRRGGALTDSRLPVGTQVKAGDRCSAPRAAESPRRGAQRRDWPERLGSCARVRAGRRRRARRPRPAGRCGARRARCSRTAPPWSRTTSPSKRCRPPS